VVLVAFILPIEGVARMLRVLVSMHPRGQRQTLFESLSAFFVVLPALQAGIRLTC